MPQNYFDYVVGRLTVSELDILAQLYQEDATVTLTAINNTEVFEKSKLTQAVYRKYLSRLQANGFVEMLKDGNSYKLFLSYYGVLAYEKLWKGDE